MLEETKNIFTKTGFMLSIISIIIAFIPMINYLSIVIGILAVILGIVGLCQKDSKSIAVTAIVLGILSGIFAFYIMNSSMNTMLSNFGRPAVELDEEFEPDNTDNILENEVEIKFGNYKEKENNNKVEIKEESEYDNEDDSDNDNEDDENYEYNNEVYYSFYSLPVTIKNKSSEMKSFTITVEAIDKNGCRIAEDELYVHNLRSEQSYKTNLFQYSSDDELAELLQDATFKVLTASNY